jgi:hypothetical protein
MTSSAKPQPILVFRPTDQSNLATDQAAQAASIKQEDTAYSSAWLAG